MTHIRRPDQFNGFRWEAYVEDAMGSETIGRAFATEAEAVAQARAWRDQMDHSGHVIGR